jgi:hypothetical protein
MRHEPLNPSVAGHSESGIVMRLFQCAMELDKIPPRVTNQYPKDHQP